MKKRCDWCHGEGVWFTGGRTTDQYGNWVNYGERRHCEICDGTGAVESVCAYAHRGGCEGEIDYVLYISASHLLCRKHADDYLSMYERSLEYQSDIAPSWFDESYAGERWDDDY